MGILKRLWPDLRRDVVLNRWIASPLVPGALRWRALRSYGMQVEPSRISPGVWFGSRRVSIGADTFISYGCMFNTTAPIRIGSNCDIAMRVTFVTTSHVIGDASRRAGTPTAAPITVGDGTWIGAGATILPGVTLGAGSVIAAGAVVSKSTEPHGVYAGVPARLIRSLALEEGRPGEEY